MVKLTSASSPATVPPEFTQRVNFFFFSESRLVLLQLFPGWTNKPGVQFGTFSESTPVE
ncbi:uncharacterized protein H6S33_008311, partial [Morchella sextelata]|uniref:uncharacterized protein n=1 Tax=Morchella sextelata TaxID=1174677 RepID=UPI001D05AF9F